MVAPSKFASTLHSTGQSLSRTLTHSSLRSMVELSSPHNKNIASQKNGRAVLLHCLFLNTELMVCMVSTKRSEFVRQIL